MRLKSKLALAQTPLALSLLLVGVLAISTLSRLGRQSQVILKDNYRSVLAAERMKESIERMDSAAAFLLQGRRDKALQQQAQHRLLFERELLAAEGNLTEPGEGDVAQKLRRLFTRYKDHFDQLLATADRSAADPYYFDVLQPDFIAVKDSADDLLALNQDAMVRKSDQAGALSARMNTLVLLAVLITFVLALVVSTTLLDKVLRPLDVLRQAVRRIGEGDLEARAQVRANDEIAELATDFNTMAGRLGQYHKSSLGELLQAQQASQAAIDSLPDPILIFGLAGEMQNVNQAAEKLLGLSLEEGPADPLKGLEPAVRAMLERVRGHVLSGKGAYLAKGYEEAVVVPSPEGDRSLLPRATPVYTATGSVAGVTVVLQDVSRLRRFDELKNDLVATVAHEFRTPLTSLRMAIHLCIEESAGPLTEKQADLLYAAREDCERLQSIVDELLDMSRLKDGRIELHPRLLRPAALIESLLPAHQALAAERSLLLKTSLSSDLPDVFVDKERVQLVFSNLLINAIRHSPEGGSIELLALPQGLFVRFEIVDHGPGISQEFQQRIFEKFFRVPGAPAGSAGLGLSIASEIVTAHRGEIGVRSQPGHGSTFWFTLPTGQAQANEQALGLASA